jgi:predicted naringenin-chalcone synthase
LEKSYSAITSIGYSLPKYTYNQKDLAVWMNSKLNQKDDRYLRKLKVLYQKTLIEKRHSVLADFKNDANARLFKKDSKVRVEDRLEIYNEEAPKLSNEAIEKCLQNANVNKRDITHLITVSCTGMSAPGLEQILKNEYGFSSTCETYAVNFIGCYAAFPAMKMADAICTKTPSAKVLIVAVELCTLHFQNRTEDDFLLSNSLFSDGAAAALIEKNSNVENTKLELLNFFNLQYWDGRKDMAWNIHSDGFLMKLSSYVPELVKNGVSQIIKQINDSLDFSINDIQHWAIHPGGRKILESCQSELNISKESLANSYDILKNFGNMSAPTIFFVLHKLLYQSGNKKMDKVFACGFGPGLTLESALLQIK